MTYAENSYTALTGADAPGDRDRMERVPRTGLRAMRKLLGNPINFDGRNLYNPEQIRAHGFTYISIGRP